MCRDTLVENHWLTTSTTTTTTPTYNNTDLQQHQQQQRNSSNNNNSATTASTTTTKTTLAPTTTTTTVDSYRALSEFFSPFALKNRWQLQSVRRIGPREPILCSGRIQPGSQWIRTGFRIRMTSVEWCTSFVWRENSNILIRRPNGSHWRVWKKSSWKKITSWKLLSDSLYRVCHGLRLTNVF